MATLVVATGGTVDKDYPRLHSGYAFEFGDPAVGRILADLQLDSDCEITVPFQKDSTEVTDEDRAALLSTCISCGQARIVVTHGTDTLIDSAAVLGKSAELAALGKTIIVTGAMRPERFSNSDAKFNVGVAFGALECAAPGVYVAMCGRVRKWDAVERCFQTGKFVDVGCAKPPMAFRTMPGTNMRLSLLSLGCFAFGGDKKTGAHNGPAFAQLHAECWGAADDDASIATVRAALESGINVFDNAEMYGDGWSETVLGRALCAVAADFPRDSYYIFTKVSEAFLAPELIEAHLDASLARLQTEYVDLYQVCFYLPLHFKNEFC